MTDTELKRRERGDRMDDLISRQAAINAISCDITVTGRQNAELVAATIGTFADRIKALPSAQPEPIKYNIENFNKEDWERLEKEWRNAPITVLPAQPDIIRCKDCKWHEGRYHCLNFDVFGFDYNDYCSLAERRQNE